VIAAYLLSLNASQKLLPPSGAAHWQALTIEALCDGVLDAALSLRFEAAAGGTDRLPFWADRMRRSITGAVRALPARLAQIDDNFSYAIACVVVAVEYLDFRFPEMDWRGFAPELDALHKRWGDRPSLANTRPA
jgi:glutathione S-transferase